MEMPVSGIHKTKYRTLPCLVRNAYVHIMQGRLMPWHMPTSTDVNEWEEVGKKSSGCLDGALMNNQHKVDMAQPLFNRDVYILFIVTKIRPSRCLDAIPSSRDAMEPPYRKGQSHAPGCPRAQSSGSSRTSPRGLCEGCLIRPPVSSQGCQ